MGAGIELRGAALQAPLGRQRRVRARRIAGFDTGGLGSGDRRVSPTSTSRAPSRRRPALRRRADAGGAPEILRAHEQVRHPRTSSNCGACGYDTCREHAVAICAGPGRDRDVPAATRIEELRKHGRRAAAVQPARLETTQEALVKSEKLASMGQLAAGIAHEVNNPLGVVLMYAHLLLEDCEDDPEVSADLKMIVEQADRCKKIVAGLLNFARQNKVVRQPIDLTEPGGAEVLRSAARRRGRRGGGRRPPGRPDGRPRRRPDRPGAHQPAHQRPAAMPDGGTITVTLRRHRGRTCLVTVAGHGHGHPPRSTSTSSSARSSRPSRSARGPASASPSRYGIVKMHRGEITVASNADPAAGPTGTTFTISLPRFEAETDVPASLQEITGAEMNPDTATRESLMDPQQVTLKVVMVDDEEALCLGVRRIIQKYKVHVADVLVDADYAFQLLHERRGLPRVAGRGRRGRPAAARPQAAGRRRHGRPRRHEQPGP